MAFNRYSLVLASFAEAATGAALLVEPSMVGRLLLGEDLTGVAIPVARLTGIALISLGVACWPGSPRLGMTIYNGSATIYLAYIGLAGGFGGVLLWPAVIVHLLMTILLLWPAGQRAEGHE